MSRGLAAYTAMWLSLRTAPATAHALAGQFDIKHEWSRRLMAFMWRKDRVHIGGWAPGVCKRFDPIFHFGAGTDAPHPGSAAMAAAWQRYWEARQAQVTANFVALESVLVALEEAASITGVFEETGVSRPVIRQIVNELRAASFAHISEWQIRALGRGQPIAMWTLGPGRDRPRPKPQSRREINARHWQRRHLIRAHNTLHALRAPQPMEAL